MPELGVRGARRVRVAGRSDGAASGTAQPGLRGARRRAGVPEVSGLGAAAAEDSGPLGPAAVRHGAEAPPG